jgi:hypothetical protein
MVGSVGATAAVAPTAGNTSAKPKPTVLVHGGFADANISWTDVTERLQKRG